MDKKEKMIKQLYTDLEEIHDLVLELKTAAIQATDGTFKSWEAYCKVEHRLIEAINNLKVVEF